MNPISEESKGPEQPLGYVPDVNIRLVDGFTEWELAYHPSMKTSYFDVVERFDVLELADGLANSSQPVFVPKAETPMAAAYLRIACRISGKVFRLGYKSDDTGLLAFDNSEVVTYIRTHPDVIVVKVSRMYKLLMITDNSDEDTDNVCSTGEHFVLPIQYATVDLVDNVTGDVLKRLIGPALHESI